MATHPKQPRNPNRQEIAAACRRIQATWSPAEKLRRRTGLTKTERQELPAWEIPTIHCHGIHDNQVI